MFYAKIMIVVNKFTWNHLAVCDFIYNFAAKLV